MFGKTIINSDITTKGHWLTPVMVSFNGYFYRPALDQMEPHCYYVLGTADEKEKEEKERKKKSPL